MRRAAVALVAFVALEYFGPLTPQALFFFTLVAVTEVAGVIMLRRMSAAQRAQAERRPSRLLASN